MAVSLKYQASGFLLQADHLSLMQYEVTSLGSISVISSDLGELLSVTVIVSVDSFVLVQTENTFGNESSASVLL